MDRGANITSFLCDPLLRAERAGRVEKRGGGGKEEEGKEREGEILPLITSWVTAPAGRCQNPTLSDMWKGLWNGGWSNNVRTRGKVWKQEKGWDALKGEEKLVRIDYGINKDKCVEVCVNKQCLGMKCAIRKVLESSQRPGRLLSGGQVADKHQASVILGSWIKLTETRSRVPKSPNLTFSFH